MKKTFFTKMTSAVIVAATIATLSPLKASAEWSQNDDRTWSYKEGNKVAKGWKNISNEWYYFNENGRMKTDWTYEKGNWYYLNNSGVMQEGWNNINGTWYYFNNNGVMQIGWIQDNNKWYYMNSNGAMQTGIQNIEGKVYCFDESGKLIESSNDSGQLLTNSAYDGQAGNNTVDINGLPQLPRNYSISIQIMAENKIFELMNEKRTEAGLNPLVMDNELVQVARYKSNHMIQYNYFDHTTPEGNNWTSWLKAINYEYATTGENIAYNNYEPVELFNQWWNSPGHKANMMNPSYTKVGIGVISGSDKYMGTQTFSN
ncbi:CAP domain-containing protein [Clostridium beijerinckii]|uniref:CAP domain-containing protein n=1 Tax=Clostridium beijerinckii TaxID=1520 RepID=UPI0003D39526|nr:CAP domain-containing protein [Clostridium beijerinckii]ALB44375.1 serine protease [Clostridium beijerinckii NRRL B-598]